MSPAAVDLRFDAAIVRAEGDEADLDWLVRVLACGFEPVTNAEPHATVRLVIDAARFAELEARGATGAGARSGFAQDAEPYPLTPWRSADETTELLHDAQVPAFHAVDRPHRTVTVIAPKRGFASRLALLRVVRELAMDRVVADGAVLVHGAALATTAGVVVIAAPKRHGKTTLLLSLLTQTAAAYVSNDRCLLRAGADAATIRGLPTIVSITRDGLTRFPAVRDRLLAARPDLAGDRPSIGLTPDELIRILDLPSATSGPLAAFLLPRITANAARLTVTRLDPAAALAPLRAGLFRAGHPTLLGDVFAWDTPPGLSPSQAAEPTLQHVATHLPCFAVEIGGALPPDEADCQALLRVLRTRA